MDTCWNKLVLNQQINGQYENINIEYSDPCSISYRKDTVNIHDGSLKTILLRLNGQSH